MEIKEFQEKLKQLLSLAQEKDKNVTQEEILDTFGNGQLSQEQLKSLYQYLKIQGIRIEGVDLSRTDLEREIEQVSERPAGEAAAKTAANLQKDANEENAKNANEVGESAAGSDRRNLEPEDADFLCEMRELLQAWEPEKAGEREYLLLQMQNGYREAQERLAQIFLPDILEIAEEVWHKGVFLSDLVQEGNLCLLTMEYDKMPSEEKHAWVRRQIRNSMLGWLEEQTMQKEQDQVIVERVQHLEQAIKELTDDENTQFSVEELSAFLDMEREEIEAVLRLTGEGNSEN